MSHLSYDNAILKGAARGLFVQAYASRQEERYSAGKKNARRAGPEEDWMDIAPPTPRDAYLAASWLLAKLECANKRSVFELITMAARADGLPGWGYVMATPSYQEDFGHYIAMQAVGHGVSWFDNHERFEMEIPHFEYYL